MAFTMTDMADPTAAAEELFADGVVSMTEAVALSRLSRSELYRRMDRGALAYTVQGRRRLIPRRALVRMLAAGLRGGAGPLPRSAA